MPDRRDRPRAGPRADHGLEADVGGERDSLVDRVDRSAWHARGDQIREPGGGRAAGQSLDQQRPELVTVGGAVCVMRESRVLRQLRRAEHPA
jgi:hypothetical protein